MITTCSVCRQPIPDDEGPSDFREVIFRNGLIAQACLRCWFIWPDANKFFPAHGYGRAAPPLDEQVKGVRRVA